jgi:TRAP-type C4-dicarboxylate transport system permease small subunit
MIARAARGISPGSAMQALSRARALFQRLLEAIVMVLLSAMALLVCVAVVYREAGASLVWYDEVAGIMLTWITYYGAALAALKRSHIGVADVVRALPPAAQRLTLIVAEIVVIGFFALLAWYGWRVFHILEGSTLVSLPTVPVQWTQSVIPIGAMLFIVAEVLSIPEAWRRLHPPAASGVMR